MSFNGEAGLLFVIVALTVLWLGARTRKSYRGTAHPPGRYGSWTSIVGGMAKPFFSTPWFLALCVAGIIIWFLFASGH